MFSVSRFVLSFLEPKRRLRMVFWFEASMLYGVSPALDVGPV